MCSERLALGCNELLASHFRPRGGVLPPSRLPDLHRHLVVIGPPVKPFLPCNDIILKRKRFGIASRDIDGGSRSMQDIVIVFATLMVFADIGYSVWTTLHW